VVAAAATLSGGMLAMGIAGVYCGVIATLLLPETAGRDLSFVAPDRVKTLSHEPN
jgi:hypothetical protein